MTTELELYKEMGALSPEVVQAQVNLIQRVLQKVMKPNIHYGKIPGAGDKPTLLKPGAEKICVTFRLSPTYEIEEIEHDNDHLEYRVKCTLTHIPTGQVFGQGVGSCSTLEGKYRFRTGPKESTGKPVPQEYWKDRDQELIGGKGHTTSKIDGKWMICIQGEKVEHDNPADYYNTVLKMAKKRAHVDAVLTCTAASDCFTQDIEDMPEVIPGADTFKQQPEKPIKYEESIGMEVPVDTTQAGVDDIPLTHDTEGQGEIPYEQRPFPGKHDKVKTVGKKKGGVLFAKLKNIPDLDNELEAEILSDLNVESVYEVAEDDFEKVKKHLDMFYKKKSG